MALQRRLGSGFSLRSGAGGVSEGQGRIGFRVPDRCIQSIDQSNQISTPSREQLVEAKALSRAADFGGISWPASSKWSNLNVRIGFGFKRRHAALLL